MKQRNAIIVSMLLLSLFSGPLSISERVYLFILFHPQKENSFEVGSGKCWRKKRRIKPYQQHLLKETWYNFLYVSKNFSFFLDWCL